MIKGLEHLAHHQQRCQWHFVRDFKNAYVYQEKGDKSDCRQIQNQIYEHINNCMNSLKKDEKSVIVSIVKAEMHIMSEQEIGEYLRSNGLYSADLAQWKQDCTNGLKPDVGRPKKDPEVLELRKREQELESELKLKDKALAEVTARVILLKKSHLLFGKDEDS